jgi:hypothetical protein
MVGSSTSSAIWQNRWVGASSGTVTFLLTDIEESTRLFEEYEASMRAAVARHDELPHSVIADYDRGYRGSVFIGMPASSCCDLHASQCDAVPVTTTNSADEIDTGASSTGD